MSSWIRSTAPLTSLIRPSGSCLPADQAQGGCGTMITIGMPWDMRPASGCILPCHLLFIQGRRTSKLTMPKVDPTVAFEKCRAGHERSNTCILENARERVNRCQALTTFVKLLADLCGDGEARRHPQTMACHLTEVGALAAKLHRQSAGGLGSGQEACAPCAVRGR
eukprot:364159-Chlamydomonas_euryale.AAC.8